MLVHEMFFCSAVLLLAYFYLHVDLSLDIDWTLLTSRKVFEAGNTIMGFLLGKHLEISLQVLDQNVNESEMRKREQLSGPEEEATGKVENTESMNQKHLDLAAFTPVSPIPSLVGETAALKRNEILGYLMNNEVQKIGIYGMPGVGKTSVIKLVNNELLKDTNQFNIVVWITVSRKCGVIELQNKIAQAISAVISEDEDETIREGMLPEILAQKGRYVLILDDVLDNFSLEEVVIPEPTASNGSKLVLTSRSLDVCRRMDCQVIKMEPLPGAEAWTLFLDKVGQNLTWQCRRYEWC
ncbi:probable disease resistance protein At4g14610 [Durio zibethinus]|uniref:Probable disease resistance protein At4g14610 n=1 Tax=Durio zibethinus TaxID=66656 RepID=A0A6P5WPB9_DURZI|nr:probable disease resistance protein At4g14610 [Durio zibethinus]